MDSLQVVSGYRRSDAWFKATPQVKISHSESVSWGLRNPFWQLRYGHLLFFSAVEVFIFRKNNTTQQTQLQRFIIWQYVHTLHRGIFTDLKDADMGLRIDIK